MHPLKETMTSTADRLKVAGLTLLIALGVALVYTGLHEAGHALAGLVFGGRIGEVDLNFFNLGAHVNIIGSFTRFQEAVINLSGVGLPVLVWLVLILALPKNGSPMILWTKFIASAGTLCSLLAWVLIPFFYLNNNAPIGDDVTRFLVNSGLPPLAVAFVALTLFTGGWWLFIRRGAGTPPLRQALFSSGSRPAALWRWVAAGGVMVAALVGGGIFLTSALRSGLPQPPKGYVFAAAVDLSSRDLQAETIASFNFPRAGDAAILLRVTGLDAGFIDVTLVPSQGPALQLLHGEDFSSAASDIQNQYRLPAGVYGIALTSRGSTGKLKVYFWLP
jgi:hypothetical protein